MWTWRFRPWAFIGCWVWILHACADLGPASAAPATPGGQLMPADEFTHGSAFPPTVESNSRPTVGLESPETAEERSTAAHVPPSLSDVAATGEMPPGPGDSAISNSPVDGPYASFPAEGEPTGWVSAASGNTGRSATDPRREVEPGHSSGDATETPTFAAVANSSLGNGTASSLPAAATSALSSSHQTPFSSLESVLGESGVGLGAASSGTASSPPSAAANVLATPGAREGPEELASSRAFSSERPFSPSVVAAEPTRAAFLAATASPRETASEASVLGTENPGYDVPGTLKSSQLSSESESALGTSAFTGKTASRASAASGGEVFSAGPAEGEGEGVSPSVFPSIIDSNQASPSWEAVFAPAATEESRGAADKESTKAHLDTSPWLADAEPSPADLEEPLPGETAVLSRAGTSPHSFLEPGLATAIPTLPGETSFSALTSPIDSPAEPTVPETENTASSLTGVAGAPSSSEPAPDAAFGAVPVAVWEEEEPVNLASTYMKETPFTLSAGESMSPAGAARGLAGTQAPGSVASGASVPHNTEPAPRSSAPTAKEEATSNTETQRETSPSPRDTELSPAPADRLPPGEAGVLAKGETSPRPSLREGMVLTVLPAASGATSPPGFAPPSETPAVLSASPAENPGSSTHGVSSTMETSPSSLVQQAILTPAASETRGDLAHLVSTAHGDTLFSTPNVQRATNPSSQVPELGPGSVAAIPTGDVDTMASSPPSAAANVLATPGAREGPEELASSRAFSSERPFSPSVAAAEPTRAAFLAATASPRKTAPEASVLGTENPGYDVPGTLQSPQLSSERESALGTSAFTGKTASQASAAGGGEAFSGRPAEGEGEGVSPSVFPSIIDSDQVSPSWEAVFAPAATEESGGAADEEPTKAQLAMSPWLADAEPSPADLEEPLPGETAALSRAGTSLHSFLEPGLATAIPTLPGETSFSALTSPIDSPAEPTVPETENTASSLTGVAGAPSSSEPAPDAAFGAVPVAVWEEEEPVNPASTYMKETSFTLSAGESMSPAGAASGLAGTQVVPFAAVANSFLGNGTASLPPAAATSAVSSSHQTPFSSLESVLGGSGVGLGAASSETASSPPSAAANVLATPGAREGPEELASSRAFSSERPFSPSVVAAEPTRAAFLAATASPRETASEASVLGTENPGYDVPGTLKSSQLSSESESALGTSAFTGKTASRASAASGGEVFSAGPAEGEGEGVSPSVFPSIIDSDQASPSWEAVFAPAATEESGGAADEEPTKAELAMSPWLADAEPSPVDLEEPLPGETAALSRAGTSLHSFLEPGLATAIPTLPGETSFSALTSPIDSPADPTVPETENTASSLTGVADAPSSSEPAPDAAFGAVPVAVWEEEEPVNLASTYMKETSFTLSAGESMSPAGAARGLAGTQAPGSVASGASMPPNTEPAPRSSAPTAKEEATSNTETQRETSPSPRDTELSPAPADRLPPGEAGVLAKGETSPRPSLREGMVLTVLPAASGATSPPGFAPPSETPAVLSASPAENPGGSTHGVSSTMETSPSSLVQQAILTPAASETRGDLARLVSTAHGDTLFSTPNVQRATNPSPQVPELGPGSVAAIPTRDLATWASADASPPAPSGDGTGSGRHAPSGGTSPPDLASPSGAHTETATSGMTKSGSSPTSFPGAAMSSPVSSAGETGPGTASSDSESGVPGALPGLQAVIGGSPSTTGLATSRTPSATEPQAPFPQSENGHVAPEVGATVGLAGATHLSAAPTPAQRVPLLGTTAHQYDAETGSDEKRTESVPPGTSEAVTSGTGKSATLMAVRLYPYGAKENDQQYVERRVDFNSPIFKPEIGFPFGKRLRDSLYFTDNGQVIFPASANDVFPYPDPPPGGFNGREKVPMVAVFWANADFSKGVGTTFYQEFLTLNSTKHPFVRDVEAKIQRYLKTSYTAKWTLKITWEKAPAYAAEMPVSGTNTYQAVLTTDGIKSYALILYQDGGMKWDYTRLAPATLLLGYSSGDGSYRNDELTRRPLAVKYRPDRFRGFSTDLRGLWVYRLDSRMRVNYRLRCLEWVNLQEDLAVRNKAHPSCPCFLPQGKLDQRYRWSGAGVAGTRETMLYVSAPNQQCCLYNCQKELVNGRQERSWKYSRQVPQSCGLVLKVQDWCCQLAGSPQLCAKYGEKRAEISCTGYRQPHQTTSSEETERASEEQRD